MKISFSSLLLATHVVHNVNAAALKQLNTQYIIPYQLVNGIAMANFSFPDTFANTTA
jgi:hypothetical protein